MTINVSRALETLLVFSAGPDPVKMSEPGPLSLRATRAAVMREAGFKLAGLIGLPRVCSAFYVIFQRACQSPSLRTSFQTIDGLNELRDALADDVRDELDKSLPKDR